MNAMNAMNVTTLNAHRSFGKLMEISLSHDAGIASAVVICEA